MYRVKTNISIYFYRDQLALKLVEKVNQNHKDKKHRALSVARSYLGTPVTKFGKQSSMERMSSMSPAAQKLLSSKFRVQHGSDSALRASYTPKGSSSYRKGLSTPGGASTPSSIRSLSLSKTPSSEKRKATPSSSTCLTDNLLKLPKKSNTWCKASDFF